MPAPGCSAKSKRKPTNLRMSPPCHPGFQSPICGHLLTYTRYGVRIHFPGQRHFARRAVHRRGLSAGVSGQPQKLAVAPGHLRGHRPGQDRRGYAAGFPHPMPARKHQVAGRRAGHPCACRPHHGHGRLPPVLRLARRPDVADLRQRGHHGPLAPGVHLRLSPRALAQGLFHARRARHYRPVRSGRFKHHAAGSAARAHTTTGYLFSRTA